MANSQHFAIILSLTLKLKLIALTIVEISKCFKKYFCFKYDSLLSFQYNSIQHFFHSNGWQKFTYKFNWKTVLFFLSSSCWLSRYCRAANINHFKIRWISQWMNDPKNERREEKIRTRFASNTHSPVDQFNTRTYHLNDCVVCVVVFFFVYSYSNRQRFHSIALPWTLIVSLSLFLSVTVCDSFFRFFSFFWWCCCVFCACTPRLNCFYVLIWLCI